MATWLALASAQGREVEILVWANADVNERYRTEAVALAALILNEELKIEGREITVTVRQQSWSGPRSWQQMKQAFALAVESGKGPHLIVAGHEDIAVWGRAGLIQPAEEYIDLEAWPFIEVFPNLWPVMSWNGQVWGIPQDAEARPLFAWKPHLRAIGYSDADIAALPGRIERGEYRLRHVLEDARKIQEMGLVDKGYGFYPRPARGPDFWQFYMAFGGRMTDPDSGRLLLDRASLLDYYRFFHDAVFTYEVTRKNHLGMDWDQWFAEVANGKAGLWHGGTWHYARYARHEGLTDFFDKIMFALIPAGGARGRAVTLTHPLAYLISKRAQGDEAEITARLITIVSEPRLNTLHALASAHLGITVSQTLLDIYASDRWAAEATALLRHARALPNNRHFGQYDQLVWRGLTATWSGAATPEEAVETVVREMRATMADKVVIR
jgi:inositol-phosphate transport system substrate-binding protein